MPTATVAPSNARMRSGSVPTKESSDRVVGTMTLDEYIAFDRAAVERHELLDGKVVRMAGSSPEHNIIGTNISRAFGNALEASDVDADVVVSDQKIYIREDLILYPDVTIVPGDAQFDQNDTLLNPIAIFEILSPSTASYDLLRKFEEYRKIASLEHYVVIEQHDISVTHYAKIAGNLWAIVGQHSQLEDSLKIEVEGTEISVPLKAIYRRIAIGS